MNKLLTLDVWNPDIIVSSHCHMESIWRPLHGNWIPWKAKGCINRVIWSVINQNILFPSYGVKFAVWWPSVMDSSLICNRPGATLKFLDSNPFLEIPKVWIVSTDSNQNFCSIRRERNVWDIIFTWKRCLLNDFWLSNLMNLGVFVPSWENELRVCRPLWHDSQFIKWMLASLCMLRDSSFYWTNKANGGIFRQIKNIYEVIFGSNRNESTIRRKHELNWFWLIVNNFDELKTVDVHDSNTFLPSIS